MIHHMKLSPQPFYFIQNGTKTYELRLFDEKRQALSIGDQILFENTENPLEQLMVVIIELHRFASFDELYRTLPLLKCGYTADTIIEADSSDMESYYSKSQQEEYGVVAIEVSLCEANKRENTSFLI